MINKIVTNVTKEPEFLAFLNLVEEQKIPDTWELVAQAIGVHPNTIKMWRKTPEFQKALAQGIKNAIENMESSGRRDWRMWREKIALLTKEKQEGISIEAKILVIPSELMSKYDIASDTKVSSE
jgi:hypothetical protein